LKGVRTLTTPLTRPQESAIGDTLVAWRLVVRGLIPGHSIERPRRCRQETRDNIAKVTRLPLRNAPGVRVLEQIVARSARHVLAHDERAVVLLAHIEHGDDVRMTAEPAMARASPRTRASPASSTLGLDERDRDVAVEPRVAHEYTRFFPALADEPAHRVAPVRERGPHPPTRPAMRSPRARRPDQLGARRPFPGTCSSRARSRPILEQDE